MQLFPLPGSEPGSTLLGRAAEGALPDTLTIRTQEPFAQAAAKYGHAVADLATCEYLGGNDNNCREAERDYDGENANPCGYEAGNQNMLLQSSLKATGTRP